MRVKAIRRFTVRTVLPESLGAVSALAANLCRCGTHNRIVRAVLRAAQANGRT